MIVGADQRVRNAFRATLRDEPSGAFLVTATQEVDAADVLEVTDLANAIARAEEVIRARSSNALPSKTDASPSSSGSSANLSAPDIFDALVATDDIAGSAIYAPYRPTPVPPAILPIPAPPKPTFKATLMLNGLSPDGTHPLPAHGMHDLMPTPLPLPPPTRAPAVAPVPVVVALPTPIPEAARTAPILILDEDAFYHPAGRIRGFADVTIEGYRPEPTLMVRLRARRSTLSWVVIAVLVPLALFTLFVLSVTLGVRASSPSSTPAVEIPTAKPVQAAPKPAPAPTPTVITSASPVVPVFDVKSLPTAAATTARPRR